VVFTAAALPIAGATLADERSPAVAQLAQAANRLDPAEAVSGELPFLLTNRVMFLSFHADR
jgi:hypothetical protein